MTGPLESFLTALIGLEQTIDPTGVLKVVPGVMGLRPLSINPPAIYNWVLPSPTDIVATDTVEDTMNFAVRVVIPTGEIDDEQSSAVRYWDMATAVLDGDLVHPHSSVFKGIVHRAMRTTRRTLNDEFDSIPYTALEIVIQAEFRRYVALR